MFEPLQRHCVVSLSKNINTSLLLVQPRKIRTPFDIGINPDISSIENSVDPDQLASKEAI